MVVYRAIYRFNLPRIIILCGSILCIYTFHMSRANLSTLKIYAPQNVKNDSLRNAVWFCLRVNTNNCKLNDLLQPIVTGRALR